MQLSLRGPWAALEERHQQDASAIAQLKAEVLLLTEQARVAETDRQLAVTDLQSCQSELVEERRRSGAAAEALQTGERAWASERAQLQQQAARLTQQLGEQTRAACQRESDWEEQVAALQREASELRQVVDACLHKRRAPALRLETAMTALHLSLAGAAAFLAELEAVRHRLEGLAEDNDRLATENVLLQQQRDSRAGHASLLTAENTRLFRQLEALKKELAAARAAADRAAARPAPVRAARPEPVQRAASSAKENVPANVSAAKAAAANPPPKLKAKPVAATRQQVLAEAQLLRQASRLPAGCTGT